MNPNLKAAFLPERAELNALIRAAARLPLDTPLPVVSACADMIEARKTDLKEKLAYFLLQEGVEVTV